MNGELNVRERPMTAVRKTELLDRIQAYVDENLDKRITLREVAQEFNVSISTVTQLFQKRAGITFHQYLTQCRMRAAEELIRSGTPLEAVGRKLGYTDHSSFYRAFRQTYGVSPRDYRRKETIDA